MDNNDVWGTWDTKDDSIQKGFYIELPAQTVYLDKTENPILQCQLRPCQQEDALRESFVVKLDKKTNSVRIKNISIESLQLKLYLRSNGWESSPERSVNCVIGEKIGCEGIVSATKTKQGLTFYAKEDWGNTSYILKTLRIGETTELLQGDEIIIHNQLAITLKQHLLVNNNQGNNPFDF